MKRELIGKEIKAVNRLIKTECCNYFDGNCILLDDGEEHVCPQLISRHLCCKWFEKAVLPLDGILLKGISDGGSGAIKKCASCGGDMIAMGSRKKYCDVCAKARIRKQKADYMAKKRGITVEK